MKKRFLDLIILMLILVCSSLYVTGQVYINEFLTSNTHTNIDPETSIFSDWIELYNYSTNDVDLGGYYLSDNQDDPQKWIIPQNTIIEAGDYLLIWADKSGIGLHTNFGLSKDGEEICLFYPNLLIADRFVFIAQIPDISQGRSITQPDNWLFFDRPTPGQPNTFDGVSNKITASDIEFSIPGGFYTSAQSIEITSLESGGIIRYTLDGSIPDYYSPEYINNISVDTNSVVRARCFVNGKLPGNVITQTYFINEEPDLPVFSISTDPEYLWNEDYGIYIDGSSFNGSRLSRNCCKKGLERPIHIEFYETDGSLAFQSDAGIEIKGRQNCEFPRKPLGIYFRSKYGQNEISHKIFEEKNIEIFRSFMLRPGGADGIGNLYNGTMFRDGFLSTMLIDRMDIDYEAFRPAILYINGQYWGIHNIRERIKSDYFETNHNVDPENLDILENPDNGGIIQGDDLHYMALLNFLGSNDLSIPANYEYVKTQVDINELINYQIAEIFVNNADWAFNNVEAWRPRTEDGKWRWVFYDVEGGFGLYSDEDYKADRFNFSQDNFLRHRWFFTQLLQNNEFKSEFVQRFASHLNTTFETERVLQILERMKAEIEDEMPRDIERWGGKTTNGGGMATCLESMHDWNVNVEIMREFARQRPAYVKNHIKSHFGLSGEIQVIINSENGNVNINGVIAKDTSTFFKGLPIRLEAIPDIGYRFVGWENISDDKQIQLETDSNMIIVAVFEPTGENILPSVISGNMVLTEEGSPYLGPGDITIPANSSLTLEAGVEIQMPPNASIYDYGKLEIKGNGNSPVIIKSNLNNEMERWGAICIIDAVSDTDISYLVIENASRGGIDPLKYSANISVFNSNISIENLVIEDAEDLPFYSEYGNIIIRNSNLYSSGVCDYINITHTSSALIENCIFPGNNAYDVDAIDYDFVEGGIIRNNYISGFSGINSDGIDIGDSHDIIVENNTISGIIDKGVSVGGASTAVIVRNIFINCNQGIGIKDEGSYAYIDHNTFFNNSYSVACFQKTEGRGGGSAEIINSILSKSSISPYLKDEYSDLIISYSISDTDVILGTGNIFSDPMLADPGNDNFELLQYSPCIDKGDPDGEADPDGSRSDMGAIPFNNQRIHNLFINEIYLSEDGNNNQENSWLEIYNAALESVNISGLYLSSGNNSQPGIQISDSDTAQTLIPAKSFLILQVNSNNPDNILNFNLDPEVSDGIFRLTQLLENNSYILDSLSYTVINQGKSFGRYPDGSNYLFSFNTISPGSENIPNTGQQISNVYINEILANNTNDLVDSYGEYDDWFEIYNGGTEIIDIGGLYLSDNYSSPTLYKISDNYPDSTTIYPGEFLVIWADKDINQGILHVDFKLSTGGEELALVQVNGTDTIFIDSLSFGLQTDDISYGRYPDGTNNLKILTRTTPGSSNVFTTIINPNLNLRFEVYPNPAADNLNVFYKSKEDNKLILQIFNNSGILMFSESYNRTNFLQKNISLYSYPPGIYYVRIITGINTMNKKIIVY
ncbi:CotH kinase family protein [Bacteroidota bacterium]